MSANYDTVREPERLPSAWAATAEEAVALQAAMAGAVVREDALGPVRSVAGVDVAHAAGDARLVCAAVVLDSDTLEVVETATVWGVPDFPYVPGLFSFRELPIVLDALDALARPPDLVVCDGHGIAHPRRFGLASHLGVVRDTPTIGCAKTRLVGQHDEPARERGAWSPITEGEELVGAALRTQTDVGPVYVSTGHRVSLKMSCEWTLRLSPRFRLPETTRAADRAVRMALKQAAEG